MLLYTKLHYLYQSKSYKRIFFSIISVLLVTTVMFSVFFYVNFISKQKDEATLQAKESLSRISSVMNDHYKEMMHIVFAINNNGVYSYAPITSKTQRELLLKDLIRYVDDNRFIADISYESLLDEAYIYSSQGIFDKETFQKYIYKTANHFDSEGFEKKRQYLTFATIPAGQIMSKQFPVTTVAYVFGLPFMSGNQKRLITFYVDKAVIDQIVSQFLPCEVNDIRFYEDGYPVYSLYGEWEKQSGVTVTYDSQSNGYTYELVADAASLYADYRANLLFYMVMLGVLLLVVLLFGVIVAGYNYQPLQLLVNKYASGKTGSRDEMALLEELVDNAINQKRKIQQSLFISNIVWEQYESMDSLSIDAQEAGIAFSYPLYTCFALKYEGTKENENLLAYLCEALDTHETMAVCDKRENENRITMIVNHTGSEKAYEHMMEVFKALQNTQTGMGTTENSLLHLGVSYQNARHALHYACKHELSVQKFSEMPVEEDSATKSEASASTDLQARILSCMQSNLANSSLSLDFIATQCDISTSYIARYFKMCMNVTPMQYVGTLRMDIAKKILTTTTQTLRQIVEQCGYMDESNFARKFKKLEGVTPMNYRKMHWQE